MWTAEWFVYGWIRIRLFRNFYTYFYWKWPNGNLAGRFKIKDIYIFECGWSNCNSNDLCTAKLPFGPFAFSDGSKVGAPAVHPPTAQNVLNFMQFFGKFGKIICWYHPLEGWRPLLRGILDPPLTLKLKRKRKLNDTECTVYLETSLHTARPSSRGWREHCRDSRRRHSSWLGSVEINVEVSYMWRHLVLMETNIKTLKPEKRWSLTLGLIKRFT